MLAMSEANRNVTERWLDFRQWPIRRSSALFFLIISYCVWLAVSLRWIMEFVEQGHPLTWLLSGMLILYGLLLGLEPAITRGSPVRGQVYLAFQGSLVFIASLLYTELDFFALLYVPLCGQAAFLLSRRSAYLWLGIFALANCVGQLVQFGWPEALSFIFLYTAGLVFVAAFASLTIQAEASSQQSEALLAQVQAAHQQLQRYTDQAEELAAARERNRLARDLHDSVAQTLYGLTLQSEVASRKLAAGQTEAVAEYLVAFRAGARQSLHEIRLLIFELRPSDLAKAGLTAALRTRLEAVEGRSGLALRLDLNEVGRLPARLEEGLYRIGQEALNNVLKHAQAGEIAVSLSRDQEQVVLEVRDDGCGFALADSEAESGLGLKGMRERAEQIGGTLLIESAPGSGTVIRATAPASTPGETRSEVIHD